MSVHMYRKCVKCGMSQIKDTSLTIHQFPIPGKSTLVKAKAWAIYCWPEQKSWSIEALMKNHRANKILCGKHFDKSAFLDSDLKKLMKFAVPGEKEYTNKLLAELRKEEREIKEREEKEENEETMTKLHAQMLERMQPKLAFVECDFETLQEPPFEPEAKTSEHQLEHDIEHSKSTDHGRAMQESKRPPLRNIFGINSAEGSVPVLIGTTILRFVIQDQKGYHKVATAMKYVCQGIVLFYKKNA